MKDEKVFQKGQLKAMEIKNFTITKRDGSKDRFSLDKIMNAIVKAFDSVKRPADLGSISKIISNLDIHDNIKVEDIQNQVEVSLMREGYYDVAKSFMIYRQQHSEDRETLSKLEFLAEYCEAANAATGSKYDANANVEHKNIATLIGELPKSNFIRLNRRLLTDRIKKCMARSLQMSMLTSLTIILYIRMTRRALPTIVRLSRCIRGLSVERHPLAAILRLRPTLRVSAVAS